MIKTLYTYGTEKARFVRKAVEILDRCNLILANRKKHD